MFQGAGQGAGRVALPRVRVGVDLVRSDEVAASLQRFGDRYARRVFTPGELADIGAADDAPWPADCADRLAARFAAKEATVKVLAPDGAHPDWRSMAVRSEPGGALRLDLTGTAARLAQAAAVTDLTVSVTHDRGLAAAVVVALCNPQPPAPQEDQP